MRQQDDVDAPALLLDISDSCNIFVADTLLEEEDEMLITDVRDADGRCVLVILGELHKASGDIFQPFLGFCIIT